jgi:hypothetical protein
MFPMRSRIGLCQLLAACAGIAAALTSCGGQAANGNGEDGRSQMRSNTTGATVAVPKAAVPDPRPAPVTDSLHFDLDCELRGRFVSNSDPEVVHGTYDANKPTWRDHTHLIVDLQAMRICYASACEGHGPSPISSATADRITLNDAPDMTSFIRRRDWRFEERQDDMGRVSVVTGRCAPGRFSGFPAGTRPEAAGTTH